MTVPPFLIVASLSFWGWQVGSSYLGIVLGIALEAGRYVTNKWSIRDEDYRRIWDLCSIIALCAALYCFATLKSHNAIADLLHHLDWRGPGAVPPVHGAVYFGQWWPILFFPFAAACFFGRQRSHHYDTFLWLLRRKPEFANRGKVDGIVGYLALTFLSASAVQPGGHAFFFVVSALIWCLLWGSRGRRSPLILWACLAGLAVHLGYWGQVQLNHLQGKVEEAVADLSGKWLNARGDPLRTHTSIGRIGERKLSGRIVFRMSVERGAPPQLLREASYSNYLTPTWFAGIGKGPEVIKPRSEESWLLTSAAETQSTVRIYGFLGNCLLPSPPGGWRIDGLAADEVLRNYYGTTSIKGGERYRDFRIQSAVSANSEAPPMVSHFDKHEDLTLPFRERRMIQALANNLNLYQKPESEVLLTLINYFNSEFTYSTYQELGANQLPKRTTPLEYFLTTSKSGHCEYFATATTLLLREAGIPARYAVGYAVAETIDGDPNSFVVRERHGHAWVQYWSREQGRWFDFDTTPASNFARDAEAAPAYEALTDWFNDLRFAFANWWRVADLSQWQTSLFSLLAAICLVLAWRIGIQVRAKKQAGGDTSTVVQLSRSGLDSEFFTILEALESAGYGRHPGEANQQWLTRLQRDHELDVAPLRDLLSLHQRYRFDPKGLSHPERQQLATAAQSWARQHAPA